MTALREDPLLKGIFVLNDFTGRQEIVKKPFWTGSGTGITGEDISHILYYLEKFYGLSLESDVNNAINIICAENHYHPIVQTINALPMWDGVPRIRGVLHHFLGAEENDLNEAVMKMFLCGALERIFVPGCKFDCMPCFIGKQGAGKSTFFRFLALKDEWFTDDVRNLGDAKVYEKLAGHWIVEMAEMIGTSGARSAEEIKAFLSRQSDSYRTPYARVSQDRPRQCVFVGTSNTRRILPLDRTGNRRFYPIPLGVNKPEVHILADEERSREYMRMLWAEAREIYEADDDWRVLPPGLELQMNERRKEFMTEDTAAGLVQAWLDDYPMDRVCTYLLFNECYKLPGRPDQKTVNEINAIMNGAVTGWVPGPQYRFPNYGRQRSWIRATDEEDSTGIKTA